ncbi:hypothetical protein CASFOL_006815 [Castilleja foliolosa]|uniref:F-box domain-containing protein n=1 Tax=Castilleja foliolosa TaxID=1961234 RepID=A0ABD3E7Z9_9LAMI
MVKLLKMHDEAEKPSSSAQIVASIDDLLIEIIKRLPLKKIVQLKLVSKYWNSLILDPKLCLLRNKLPSVCLMFERLEKPTPKHRQSYILSLDKSISPPTPKGIRTKDDWPCQILHSCNGLLLCVSNRAHNISPKYYVCNPTTNKHIALPEVVLDHSMTIHGMYLAFDPSKSPHSYRVVCLLRSIVGFLLLFEVYSSETGSWRKVLKINLINKN